MSDEKTEPPWKAALWNELATVTGYAEGEMDDLMAAVMPHMESSYKVGRMKATARIGRRYVQKNLELSRKLRLVREALDSLRADGERYAREGVVGPEVTPIFYTGAGYAGAVARVGSVLDKEDIASEAEAEIRKAFADRGAKAIWAMNSPEVPGSEHYRSGWADGLEAAMVTLRRMAEDGS